MLEKILPIVITVALFITGISANGVSSPSASVPTGYPPAAQLVDEYYDRLMESLGSDLIERGKAADFSLHTNFYCYVGPAGDEFVKIDIRLYSPAGSAAYKNDTTDWQLMREIQYALLDANLFDLPPEDISAAKEVYYTPDTPSNDLDMSGGINLYTDITPFDEQAVLMLRHFYTDHIDHYEYAWCCNYFWDEIDVDSRPQ